MERNQYGAGVAVCNPAPAPTTLRDILLSAQGRIDRLEALVTHLEEKAVDGPRPADKDGCDGGDRLPVLSIAQPLPNRLDVLGDRLDRLAGLIG